jgi:hypothetical protein
MGRFADGTPAMQNPDGTWNAVPAGVGGGNVQGRGLVFQYQTPNIASLAAGASSTVVIQFDQNSQFNWLRTTVSADIAGAVETSSSYVLPLCTLQMTDTGSGMSFQNAPVPIFTIAGTGQLPYVLPTPQLIQSNASYQFAFNNYSAATTYTNLRIQLQGFRIFNSPNG